MAPFLSFAPWYRFSQKALPLLLFFVAALGGYGCKPKAPSTGLFPIKVVALTSDKVGIANAIVSINNKELGRTDQFGTFVGTYRGKVRERIRIKVQGVGAENYMEMTGRLKLNNTKQGFVPAEIRFEAFLRPGTEGEAVASNPQPTPGTPMPSESGTPSAPTQPSDPPTPTPPPPTDRSPSEGREAINTGRKAVSERPSEREATNPPTPVQPSTPGFSGEFKIKATSNVGQVTVVLGKQRSTIPDAGGTIEYTHRDKRTPPRPIKVVFLADSTVRYSYKEWKISKEITLDPSQPEVSVKADFEKLPPFKILVKANVSDVKVTMDGKDAGILATAGQPLTLEYTGKVKLIKIELLPNDGKVKPKRIRKTVKLVKDQFEYTLDIQDFKVPEVVAQAPVERRDPPEERRDPPVERRDPPEDRRDPPVERRDPPEDRRDPPVERRDPPEDRRDPPVERRDPPEDRRDPPVERRDPPEDRRDPPVERRDPPEDRRETGTEPPTPARPTFSGEYKIVVGSNVGGVTVFNGSRRVGVINAGGGSLLISHKDKRSTPAALKLVAKVKDKSLYKQAQLAREVSFETGKEEYKIDFEFEKRPSIKINAKSNIPGVKIVMDRKPMGEVTAAGQAVPLEYAGKPTRSIKIEFISPNPKSYKPAKVTKTVSIQDGTFEYEVSADFEEFDAGDSVVLKPSCFKTGKKRVVTLVALAGASMLLKGDCDEALAKIGKSGRIKVQMPVGSFQRVQATFPNGNKIDKTFEVRDEDGIAVKFSSGGSRCNIGQIQKKINNRVFLEEEEINCLRDVKKENPQHFSAQISLGQFYCQKKAYPTGKGYLDPLYADPRNRFQLPYNALNLGIQYGNCKELKRSIDLLKAAERLSIRIAPTDRYANSKVLYKAMAQVYEQLYYKQKQVQDLRSSLKSMERLADILRSDDESERDEARKEVSRLKGMLAQRGGLEE